LGYKSPFTPIR